MPAADRMDVITDFLASAHIFSSTVNELVEKELSELGELLTLSQLKLLKLVAKTEPGSIREMAAFLRVSNAAASKAVDRLVRRGLITRMESVGDRRAMRISLSRRGQEVLDRYEHAQNRALSTMFRKFVVDDFKGAARLLDQLSADLVHESTASDDMCFRCGIYFRDRCLLRSLSSRVCYYHRLRQCTGTALPAGADLDAGKSRGGER